MISFCNYGSFESMGCIEHGGGGECFICGGCFPMNGEITGRYEETLLCLEMLARFSCETWQSKVLGFYSD